MLIARALSMFGWLLLLAFFAYVINVVIGRSRGTTSARLSPPLLVGWLVISLIVMTLGAVSYTHLTLPTIYSV